MNAYSSISFSSIFRDDRNTQNKNAGNGGDLVKHTVYLTLLDELLQRQPWKCEIRLRECHAGRGIYLTHPDPRFLVWCLMGYGGETKLRRAETEALDTLGLWDSTDPGGVYAGSAVLNLQALARGRKVLAEFYEQQPRTREILAGVLHASITERLDLTVSVPGARGRSLDGEKRIARAVSRWDERDVILLDPFSIWRRKEHQSRRDLLGQILNSAVERGCPLSLFFTWGNANPQADEDMSGRHRSPRNGYADMLTGLREARANVVLVRWIWKQRFAMWVLLPNRELRDALAARLRSELAGIDQLCEVGAIARKFPQTLVRVLNP